MTFTIKKM